MNNGSGEIFPCLNCGKEFFVIPSRIDKAKFCSRDCYDKYRTGKNNFTPDVFWSKVNMAGDCWEWTACKQSQGYGQIRIGGKAILAHRLVIELVTGNAVPDDLVVCHKCDNPSCVNPDHLFVGTYSDNSQDMYNKGRDITYYGEDCTVAKLTNKQANEIRKSSESSRILAARYRVSHTTILDIKRGNRYVGSI